MTTTHDDRKGQPKRIEVIARGVLQRNGQILLCHDRKGGYCYLPGGHVEPGEATSEALARELHEEAGLRDVSIGPCVLISENRFRQDERARHELYLVFHVEHCVLPDGTPLPLQGASESWGPGSATDAPAIASLEDHIEFVWVEAPALADVDLRPASCKAWLMTGPSGLDRPGWLSRTE